MSKIEEKRIKKEFFKAMLSLLVIAGVAIIGTSEAISVLTAYDFQTNEETGTILLHIYNVLRYTRSIILVLLIISVTEKIFQFKHKMKLAERLL